MADVLDNPDLVGTFFAPNDAAFDAFIKSLKTTPQELLKDTELVAKVGEGTGGFPAASVGMHHMWVDGWVGERGGGRECVGVLRWGTRRRAGSVDGGRAGRQCGTEPGLVTLAAWWRQGY